MKKILLSLSLALSSNHAQAQQVAQITPPREPIPDVMGAITTKNLQKFDDLKINLPVTRFVLANGMTVLLLEDHSIPMISYHTWYRVGSRHESSGVTGAAHMLEHMMFKGSKKYDGNVFDKTLAENGITNNAFTTYDYTGFYQNLPANKLELMMQLEVDRMSALLIRPEDLLSEKQVVAEERRWRYENQPMGLVREALMGALFKGSSYGWPVIGYMEDIQAYTSEKLRFFYDNYYGPNNAVLVLVGNFQTKDAKKLIEKYYGSLPVKQVPADNFVTKKEIKGPRAEVIKHDVQNSSYLFAFPTVPQGHADMYALDLASVILGGGSNSRLYKKAVYESQKASSAYAYHYSLGRDGMFAVGVNMLPGQKVLALDGIVKKEIENMRQKMVSEQELASAKTMVMKGFVDELTTMDGKARALATSEIVTGSYKNMFEDLDKYQKVTAMDILRVMEKYITPEGRVQVELQPQKKK